VSTRDWAEIENELNSLVPSLPRGDKMSRNHEDRQAIRTDEQTLLAHIADALVQQSHP
jgi:hypothetical protein